MMELVCNTISIFNIRPILILDSLFNSIIFKCHSILEASQCVCLFFLPDIILFLPIIIQLIAIQLIIYYSSMMISHAISIYLQLLDLILFVLNSCHCNYYFNISIFMYLSPLPLLLLNILYFLKKNISS